MLATFLVRRTVRSLAFGRTPGFAVLFSFVVLLPIFTHAMATIGQNLAVRRALLLRGSLRFLAAAVLAMQRIDEFCMCFFAVLSFRVWWRAFLLPRVRHRICSGSDRGHVRQSKGHGDDTTDGFNDSRRYAGEPGGVNALG